jgi:transcriptional regulator with XRE-family HTH domain
VYIENLINYNKTGGTRMAALHKIDVDALRQYIKERGLKQGYIAREAGMTDGRLSMLLRGNLKMYADDYFTLCGVLGVSPNTFQRQIAQVHKEA